MIHLILLTFIYTQTLFANDNIGPSSVNWQSYEAKASFSKKLNRYLLETTSPLRDSFPLNSKKIINSHSPLKLVSNSPLFDALFELALMEMEENSVSKITDAAFDGADCECFETGKKWNYVWTRDMAYSAHLSLASLDKKRTQNSLEFKVSKRRHEKSSTLEIIQDTGTGGSWPVSTDRVVWALGASELYEYLEGSEKENFRLLAYQALKNTIANDRIAIYDKSDGLYRGEESFLDWREQTYPNWTARNTVHIAMSKSLSTNILHFKSLLFLSHLTFDLSKMKESSDYLKMANDLKKAINKNFWDQEKKLYRAYITTYLDQSPVGKYELLGNSLAILFEVYETEEQKESLQNYPLVKAGASVAWPNDQNAPIYHNRGIWPFVTAYAVKAAKKAKQAHLYNHLVNSMIRGSALNLSNMENFEFLTMKAWFDDGVYSGPVVNSQRQLWSVAGYLSMALKEIIGIEIKNNKISIKPFITEKMRNTFFNNTNVISLKNFEFKKKLINIKIHLPHSSKNYSSNTYYLVDHILKDQKVYNSNHDFFYEELSPNSTFHIYLKEIQKSHESITVHPYDEPFSLTREAYEKLFSPLTPSLELVKSREGFPSLNFYLSDEKNFYFNIYKNNKILISKYQHNHFIDDKNPKNATACYTIEAVFKTSKNKSHHSEPKCFWPSNNIEEISISSFKDSKGKLRYEKYHSHFTGKVAFQLVYNNFENINSGITAAVKKLSLTDLSTHETQTGIFIMPHHGIENFWMDSNFIELELRKGHEYQIEISDFYNMSYFDHFLTYLHRGGKSGVYNHANLLNFKILNLKSN